MSLESPGDRNDSKKLDELAEELCGLKLNNNTNKMSMSLIGPQRASARDVCDNDENGVAVGAVDDNGIEMLSLQLHNVAPVAAGADVGPYSENESENSSVGFDMLKRQTALLLNAAAAAAAQPNPNLNPNKKTRAIRTNAATVKRAMSLPRNTQQPTKHLTPSKQFNSNNNNNNSLREFVSPTTPVALRVHSRSAQKPQKPNSLPQVQSRAWKPGGVVNGNKHFAATPPPNAAANAKHNLKANNAATPTERNVASYRLRSSLLSVELKSTASLASNNQANPYGTMPRRRKQKCIDELQTDNRSLELRSQSVSRDTRMTSSIGPGLTRRQLQLHTGGVSSNCSSTWTTPTQPYPMHWPNLNGKDLANKQQFQRTKIFYEQSVQTSITGNDLAKLLAGDCNLDDVIPPTSSANARDNSDRETQCSDIRDHELERLQDEVRALSATLQREREEKMVMQRELQMNTERVMGMLELARVGSSSINGSAGGWTPTSEDDAGSSCSVSGHDSLLMLESQIQMSGHELVERQQEIKQLRKLCRSLQAEMERSVAAQQFLLQEKAAIEEESNEMQDFLQHEKAAMFDALRELEADFEHCKRALNEKEEEVKTLREKCRYLVRSNEQRRQENLLLQTKNSIFKTKSKEQVDSEHATVMAAYNALSKLHLRLKSLVDELKLTYNITEQELELQTQAQLETQAESVDKKAAEEERKMPTELLTAGAGSSNGGDDFDDGALSPERHKSFIAAIIGAIRGAAAATPHKRAQQQTSIDGEQQSNSFNGIGNGNNDGEMLDHETEPCLMMDTVLQDVEVNDTYSHNLISMAGSNAAVANANANINPNANSAAATDEPILSDTLSFHNLSQAIVNRKNMEEFTTNEANYLNNDLELLNENCYAKVKDIIAKVADVDVLVTRLLRLIQMDNDNCIQQLIIDKNKLQQHKEEMLDKIRELQQVNIKLQDDLMDATQELMLKNNGERNVKKDLSSTTTHHNEIDTQKFSKNATTTKMSNQVEEKIKEQKPAETNPSTPKSSTALKDSGVGNEVMDCDVIEVMDLLHKLQGKTNTELSLKPLRMHHDMEGNVQANFNAELPSPNQLEDILNTFDTVDNLDDIDAEVQQTIMKLRENWSTLCLSNEDFVDSNANAN